MSHVTLSTCGCVIDNGDDGETFKMVYPCDLHDDPADAIAEARAYTVATEQAKLDGNEGMVVRDQRGAFHVAEVDLIAGEVRAVHASAEKLTLEDYQAAIEPINDARKAQVEADATEVQSLLKEMNERQIALLRAHFGA